MGQIHFKKLLGLIRRQVFKPFHQTDTVAVEILAQVEPLLCRVAAYAVKIYMINRQAAVILIDQRKRRAANPGFFTDPQPLCHTAHETSFSRAQLAPKANDFTAFEQLCQLLAATFGLAL